MSRGRSPSANSNRPWNGRSSSTPNFRNKSTSRTPRTPRATGANPLSGAYALPQHYEKRTSNGRSFYVDHLTKTTSFEKPLPLPTGWERRLHPGSNRVYYVNHNTKTTQWVHPNARLNNIPPPYQNPSISPMMTTTQRMIRRNSQTITNRDEQGTKDDNEPKIERTDSNTSTYQEREWSKYERRHPLKDPWSKSSIAGTHRDIILYPYAGIKYSHKISKISQNTDPRKVEFDCKVIGYHSKPFSEKWTKFRKLCDKNKTKTDYGDKNFELTINRNRIFEDSYQKLNHKNHKNDKTSLDQLRSRLNVKFKGEAGLDYGGLTKEFFLLLSRKMADPNFGFFTVQNYSLMINPRSDITVGDDHLTGFQFFGRIVGMCLFHQQFLDIGLSLPFYKKLLGKKIQLSDLAAIDEDVYNSMVQILNMTEEELTIMDYDFSILEESCLGERVTIELKPDGENITINLQNRQEFVDLMVQHKFTWGTSQQMEAICLGIQEIMPIEWVKIFNEKDLEVALCGVNTLDCADWKANTRYRNCSVNDKVIKNFWTWIKQLDDDNDQEVLQKLLQFSTGTCQVPPGGFADLMTTSGPCQFTIELDKQKCVKALPKSHTCFNRLVLPNYPTMDTLIKKLELAVLEGSEGFAFS